MESRSRERDSGLRLCYYQTMSVKKLFVFDMDDTLIVNNKWLDFNTYLGVSEEDDYRLYLAFKNNEITYAEWMVELDKLYDLANKKVTRSEITSVLQSFQVREGAKELIQTLHKQGFTTAIITGSFVITAHTLAEQLNIRHVVANTNCVFDEQDHLTHIHSKGTEGMMKNTYLLELCSALGVNPSKDCYVIGDSIYDQPMFITTGKGITFENATEELKHSALHTVSDFKDLQKIASTFAIVLSLQIPQILKHLGI